MKAERDEFPSLAFGKDRTVLHVMEVAAKLRVTQRHVIDLIEEGKLRAINVAGGNNASGRRHYRIPVDSWERYVRENLV